MTAALPRLMVAAPASGSGKTTVVCGLLRAFADSGTPPAAFKCGPDYIDPLFHTAVTGAPARNLDLFLQAEAGVLRSLARGSRGAVLALLEGVMGFYDGLGGDTALAGSWHLAEVTRTPVVLLLQCRGMSPLTAAALVRGMMDFAETAHLLPGEEGAPSRRRHGGIAALLLNQVRPAAYPRMKQVLEEATGLPVAGFLPPLPDCALESRHLGLVLPDELPGLQGKVERVAAALREHADLALLARLAGEAPPLEIPSAPAVAPPGEPVPVAIARDRAFSFYYQDALEALEEAGVRLVPFSPLADDGLPKGAAGLLLGGGYPELFARELSQNRAMRASVQAAVTGGMPTVAECGGFLYLHETLTDPSGERWPMAGVIPAGAEDGGRLGRFGYGVLTAGSGGLLLDAGESLPAHAFHYWNSAAEGEDFTFRKADGRSWRCGWHTGSLYAGFPHFHFGSRPGLAARFHAQALRYAQIGNARF